MYAAVQLQVVLSGTGLKEGIAGQVAEFYIDGSKAADGRLTFSSLKIFYMLI